jgi:hypothetical protein
MKAPTLAKNYSLLTPEERYCLMLAASARGDETERDRLIQASGHITWSLRDYAPFANALTRLDMIVFLDLLEEAARYHDAFDDLHRVEPDDEDEEESDGEVNEEELERDWALWERYFDLALASGYVLRAKAEGWKLFCEKLNIPPFLLWEMLPGFDRLQRALALAEKAAFTSEGFLRWLNRVRPRGKAELKEVPLTAEAVAHELEGAYRERVQWWDG